jgi:hypothetical protein
MNKKNKITAEKERPVGIVHFTIPAVNFILDQQIIRKM